METFQTILYVFFGLMAAALVGLAIWYTVKKNKGGD